MANEVDINGGGNDYANIAAWEAYLDDGQWSQDEIGNLFGTDDSGADTAFGSHDYNSNTGTLRADSTEWADGTDSKGAVVPDKLTFNNEDSAGVQEVQHIEFTKADDQVYISLDNASTEIYITHCVFRGITAGYAYGIEIANCDAITIGVGACLFRDNDDNAGAGGIRLADTSPTVQVYHCTFYNCDMGMNEASGVITAENCASLNYDVNNAFDDYKNFGATLTKCFSSGDGTGTDDTLRDDGTDFNDTGNRTTAADAFEPVDTGVLYQAGSAISTGWFTARCTNDMAGNAFHATTPSVGAFEKPAAVVSGISMGVIEHHFRQMRT